MGCGPPGRGWQKNSSSWKTRRGTQRSGSCEPSGVALPPVALPTGDAAEQRGRGTQATTCQTRLCPSKKLPTGAPKTRRIRALDSIKGSIKPVYTWAKWRERLPVGGQLAAQWPRDVEDCWRTVCRKIRRLQELDGLPEGVALQDAKRPGTAADLAGLRGALEREVQRTARKEETECIQAWKSWAQDAWSQKQGDIYRWIRDRADAPLHMVRKGTGELTANIQEMDEVIRESWRPVNMPYADRPEPSVTAFMNNYRQHIRGSPREARQLDAETLQARARKMGEKTANGIDLWSIMVLKRLPGVFWDRLADLLRAVEATGR